MRVMRRKLKVQKSMPLGEGIQLGSVCVYKDHIVASNEHCTSKYHTEYTYGLHCDHDPSEV